MLRVVKDIFDCVTCYLRGKILHIFKNLFQTTRRKQLLFYNIIRHVLNRSTCVACCQRYFLFCNILFQRKIYLHLHRSVAEKIKKLLHFHNIVCLENGTLMLLDFIKDIFEFATCQFKGKDFSISKDLLQRTMKKHFHLHNNYMSRACRTIH